MHIVLWVLVILSLMFNLGMTLGIIPMGILRRK